MKAVFRNRAKEVGLSELAAEKAISLNIGTLGQFGFSSSYIPGPGNQDEGPLRVLAKDLHGHGDVNDVTIGEMTAIRRLYLEDPCRSYKEFERRMQIDWPLASCVTTCLKRTAQEPPQGTLGACLFPGCCMTQDWPVDAAGDGEGRLLGLHE